MSEWREVRLGDSHIDLISGYAFKSKNFLEKQNEGSLPVIKIKNVANGDVNLEKVLYHQLDESLEKFKLSKGDVLIAMTGNHPDAMTQIVGDVSKYKLTTEALLNQRVGKIIAKNNCSLDFFYYLFKNKGMHKYLAGNSSGSANQANISKDDILGLKFPLPPLPEQKAIAEVLSSLDDKIDLLHRQNKTLEAMAETLFRQWFVEEAEEGWERVALGDLVDISSGKSLKRELFDNNGKYKVLGANGEIGKTNEWLFDEKCIFTGRVGTLGKVFINDSKAWLSDNTLVVKPKEYFYYIYFLLKSFKLENYNVGSTQPLIRQSDLKDINITLPPKKNILVFEKQSDFIFKQTNQNKKQIKILEQTRDTLLPKLMSGEVRVNSN